MPEFPSFVRLRMVEEGKRAEQSEQDLRTWLQADVDAVAANCATPVVYFALKTCGSSAGVEVITTTHTAIAEGIRHLGPDPVLARISPDPRGTFNLTKNSVEEDEVRS